MAVYGVPAINCSNINPAGWLSVVDDFTNASSTDCTETFTKLMGEGGLVEEQQHEENQYGNEKAHGSLIRATWRISDVLQSAADLRLLKSYASCSHHVNINFVSGDNAVLGSTAAGGNGAVKWKLVAEGGSGKQRYIEFMTQRFCANDGTYDTDVLWGSFTSEADVALFAQDGNGASAGLANFYVNNAGAGFEELKVAGNTSMVCELDTIVDQDGTLLLAKTIDVKLEIPLQDTSPNMLGLIDSIRKSTSNYCKLVYLDGRTFVFGGNGAGVGVNLAVTNPVKVSGSELMKLTLKGSGKMLLSDWDSDVITA